MTNTEDLAVQAKQAIVIEQLALDLASIEAIVLRSYADPKGFSAFAALGEISVVFLERRQREQQSAG
ncbi:MAG: hypothetical protein ACR2RL_21580 [Gammaproteobacteria bacterium]